jgi:hypothetical protein
MIRYMLRLARQIAGPRGIPAAGTSEGRHGCLRKPASLPLISTLARVASDKIPIVSRGRAPAAIAH